MAEDPTARVFRLCGDVFSYSMVRKGKRLEATFPYRVPRFLGVVGCERVRSVTSANDMLYEEAEATQYM